jgi:hypothetical protein
MDNNLKYGLMRGKGNYFILCEFNVKIQLMGNKQSKFNVFQVNNIFFFILESSGVNAFAISNVVKKKKL